MQPTFASRAQFLQRILDWGVICPEVRALAVVGSGARVDHPADEWSDIDLLLITTTPEIYLNSSDWLSAIGEVWVPTLERDPGGRIVEQRVLFRNGIDVDFIVLSNTALDTLGNEPLISIIKNNRVLIDKDGLLDCLPAAGLVLKNTEFPTGAEFTELVNDFWFHAVWTAKKLKRNELWTAKNCCDHYMKQHLLSIIEWHTGSPDTWYNGRFLEQWASQIVLDDLPGVFAHYDREDIWKALLNTMRLFDNISRAVASQLRFDYPVEIAQSVTSWVMEIAD